MPKESFLKCDSFRYILFLRYYSFLKYILCSLAVTVQPGLLVEAQEKEKKKTTQPLRLLFFFGN